MSAVTRGSAADRGDRALPARRAGASGALRGSRRRGGAGGPPAAPRRDPLARRGAGRRARARPRAAPRRASSPRTGATATTGARPRRSSNGFEQCVADGVHFIAEGDGPPLLLLHGWPSSVWEFHRHRSRCCGRARAGRSCRRCPATGSRSRRAAALGIVEMRRRDPRADGRGSGTSATSSPAATGARASPSGSRTRTRTRCEALHLYMMPLRRPQTWPESESASRAALEHWLAGGGRLRAHPGHAAADAGLRAAATRRSG